MTDDSTPWTLTYSILTPRVEAIQDTLDYAAVRYIDCMRRNSQDATSEEDSESSPDDDIVLNCVDNDGTRVVLTGWLPIFTAVSRIAHTMPSNAIHAGIVHEAIEDVERMSLEEIEASLDNSTWFSGAHFEESTAADFYLRRILKESHKQEEFTLQEYPIIAAYMDRNPTEASSAFDAADATSTTVSRCNIM